MFIFLKSFIVSNIWWALLASVLVSGFASGLIVHKWHRANQLSELKQAVEKREANYDKARKAQGDVDKLPDGVASRRLFEQWSRD